LRVAGEVAFLVSLGITVGSVTYHLAKGDYMAASTDVFDFATFGGFSFAAEKTGEAIQDFDEAAKAARAIREWNNAGGVPPPFRPKETQQQRVERQLEQSQDRLNHPFGF
jgi:hypothetical protein